MNELNSNTISAINKRGSTAQQKAHVEKMTEQEKRLRLKKLSKVGYLPITLEAYKTEAENMKMAYDEQWVRERSPEAIVNRKIEELMKPAFWNRLTIDNGFFDELEGVLPYFWEMVVKN